MLWGVLALLTGCTASYDLKDGGNLEVGLRAPIHESTNIGLRYAVSSSVKVLIGMEDGAGHGSGNYFKLGGHRFVITAYHNVDNATDIQISEYNGHTVQAEVVYTQEYADVAILKLSGDLVATTPAPYKVNTKENILGQTLYHSSNPGELDFILSNGFVSKSTIDTIILQSNAWYGSSGAVVFDRYGKICGTVSGLVIGQGPLIPQVLENYVIVSRISFLSKERIKEILGGETD